MTLLIRTLFLSLILSTLSSLESVQPQGMKLNTEPEPQIIVNNRVLTTVNQKAITVLDLIKKMDMIFYTQFPEYSESNHARYQFYKTRWKEELSGLIDRELILADAVEYKIEVSRGDIRQEMETLFGPNIIANLDKAGLTMDEALELVKDDITLKRVMMAKVNSKAFRQAIPQNLKEAYKQYAKENMRPETWVYRVVSIRNPDLEKSTNAAHATSLALKEGISFEELEENLKDTHSIDSSTSVNVSEEFSIPVSEVSELYKDTLTSLEPGAYSHPLAHKGRKDNKTVHRILYLKEVISSGVPPLSEVATLLRRKIIEEAMDKETTAYLDKLHQHFSISEKDVVGSLPSDFEPFVLQRP